MTLNDIKEPLEEYSKCLDKMVAEFRPGRFVQNLAVTLFFVYWFCFLNYQAVAAKVPNIPDQNHLKSELQRVGILNVFLYLSIWIDSKLVCMDS